MTLRLTQRVHDLLASHLNAGDIAIDATIGNGYDTAWLAQCVGENGHVFGFDIQTAAIDAAHARLETASHKRRATLFLRGHEMMADTLATQNIKQVAAVVFNLGFLPGSDKSIVTRTETTLSALTQALQILQINGIMSIMSYRAHDAGSDEFAGVERWITTIDGSGSCNIQRFSSTGNGPVLFVLQKLADTPGAGS